MEIDLATLREMHPRLPFDLAVGLLGRAGLGLQRGGHASGVEIVLEVEHESSRGRLAWTVVEFRESAQHDRNRITEDGAEAIALAVANRAQGWRVVRRMQRKENADWLLERTGDRRRHVAALEVSGVERGSITKRLGEKLSQVAKSAGVSQRWAGVVGFQEPTTVLRSTKAYRHGR